MTSLFKLTAVAMMSVMFTSGPMPIIKAKSYFGSGKAMISWEAEKSAGEYRVYRGTKQEGTYQLIKKVSRHGHVEL